MMERTLQFCRPTPDQWRAGDMAECIRDNWIPFADVARYPRVGDRAMVLAIEFAACRCGCKHPCLQLLGFQLHHSWQAVAFRKIVLAPGAGDRSVGQRMPELA